MKQHRANQSSVEIAKNLNPGTKREIINTNPIRQNPNSNQSKSINIIQGEIFNTNQSKIKEQTKPERNKLLNDKINDNSVQSASINNADLSAKKKQEIERMTLRQLDDERINRQISQQRIDEKENSTFYVNKQPQQNYSHLDYLTNLPDSQRKGSSQYQTKNNRSVSCLKARNEQSMVTSKTLSTLSPLIPQFQQNDYRQQNHVSEWSSFNPQEFDERNLEEPIQIRRNSGTHSSRLSKVVKSQSRTIENSQNNISNFRKKEHLQTSIDASINFKDKKKSSLNLFQNNFEAQEQKINQASRDLKIITGNPSNKRLSVNDSATFSRNEANYYQNISNLNGNPFDGSFCDIQPMKKQTQYHFSGQFNNFNQKSNQQNHYQESQNNRSSSQSRYETPNRMLQGHSKFTNNQISCSSPFDMNEPTNYSHNRRSHNNITSTSQLIAVNQKNIENNSSSNLASNSIQRNIKRPYNLMDQARQKSSSHHLQKDAMTHDINRNQKSSMHSINNRSSEYNSFNSNIGQNKRTEGNEKQDVGNNITKSFAVFSQIQGLINNQQDTKEQRPSDRCSVSQSISFVENEREQDINPKIPTELSEKEIQSAIQELMVVLDNIQNRKKGKSQEKGQLTTRTETKSTTFFVRKRLSNLQSRKNLTQTELKQPTKNQQEVKVVTTATAINNMNQINEIPSVMATKNSIHQGDQKGIENLSPVKGDFEVHQQNGNQVNQESGKLKLSDIERSPFENHTILENDHSSLFSNTEFIEKEEFQKTEKKENQIFNPDKKIINKETDTDPYQRLKALDYQSVFQNGQNSSNHTDITLTSDNNTFQRKDNQINSLVPFQCQTEEEVEIRLLEDKQTMKQEILRNMENAEDQNQNQALEQSQYPVTERMSYSRRPTSRRERTCSQNEKYGLIQADGEINQEVVMRIRGGRSIIKTINPYVKSTQKLGIGRSIRQRLDSSSGNRCISEPRGSMNFQQFSSIENNQKDITTHNNYQNNNYGSYQNNQFNQNEKYEKQVNKFDQKPSFVLSEIENLRKSEFLSCGAGVTSKVFFEEEYSKIEIHNDEISMLPLCERAATGHQDSFLSDDILRDLKIRQLDNPFTTNRSQMSGRQGTNYNKQNKQQNYERILDLLKLNTRDLNQALKEKDPYSFLPEQGDMLIQYLKKFKPGFPPDFFTNFRRENHLLNQN